MADVEAKLLKDEEKDPFFEGGPFDRSNPRSMYNVMPKEAQKTLEKVPVHLLFKDEQTLVAETNPSMKLRQIRMAFWKEYDEAQSTVSKMTSRGILRWLNDLPTIHVYEALNSPVQLAFLLCPPVSYDNLLEESLARGLERMHEILNRPLMDLDGKLDHKLAELMFKVTAFLDVRKHGMPTQRLEARSHSTVHQLKTGVTAREAQRLGIGTPLPRGVSLDDRLKELESKLGVIEGDVDEG